MKRTMSHIFTMVVALSVMGSIIAQAPTEEAAITPNCSNAFTAKFLKSKEVNVQKMVLTTPQTGEFKICSNEWNIYGTCCKPDAIQKVASDKIEKWATQMKDFIRKIDQFEKPILSRIWNVKKKMADIKAWLQNHSSEAFASQNAIIRAKKYAENFDQLMSFFEESKYKEKKERFAKDMKVCFEKVRDFRLYSLCLTCSGRASQFVDSNNSLKMSEEAAVEIVKSCVGTWNYMYNFMQSVKSMVLMSKVKKSKDLKTKKGAKKVEVQDEVGTDTNDIATDLAGDLKALSEIDPENIQYTSTVGNIIQKLFVFDGFNDDITGDQKITEEAIAEEKAEEEMEKKMSKEQLEELRKKIEKMKDDFRKKREELKKKTLAKIALIKTVIKTAQNIAKIAESAIMKIKEEIEKTKKSKILTDSVKELAIKAKIGLIDISVKKIKEIYLQVLQKAQEIFKICPGDECSDFKKTLSDYFKKYQDEKKKTIDVEKEQIKEFMKKFEEQLKAKFEAFNKLYKEGWELYSKIKVIKNKKAQQSRLLPEVKATSVDSELQKMKDRLTQIKKELSTKMVEFKKWVKNWWSNYGNYCKSNPDFYGKVFRFFQKMSNQLNFIIKQEKENGSGNARILATTTEAKSTVSVSNDSKAATMPKAEDKIPTVSITSPSVNQSSYVSIVKVVFTLFAVTLWFM